MTDILIIGGTRFVGRHIAKAFVAAGASVTLFNRGNTYGDPIAGVSYVHGDRRTELHRLGIRTWDVVVDTCAYVPHEAESAARFFADRAGAYVFVSTISVYETSSDNAIDEESPVCALPRDADRTRMVPETYGALKVLCEHVVLSTFRNRAIVLRPCLVAGPYDPTDRFTYWPLRIADGSQVLLPESPSHPVQYIDARDLADFAVTLTSRKSGGIYNVTTTPRSVTFESLFEACRRAAHVSATPVYRDAKTLLDAGIQPWSDLPLWIPSTMDDLSVVLSSNASARRAGLCLRPVENTVADVLSWARAAGKHLDTVSVGRAKTRERLVLNRCAPISRGS